MSKPWSEDDPHWAVIDRACDAFEAAWLLGERPRIEEFLARGDLDSRAGLLRELLIAEWRLRQREGEVVECVTYLERFPRDEELIRDAWEERHAGGWDLLSGHRDKVAKAPATTSNSGDTSRPSSGAGGITNDPLIGQTVSHFQIHEHVGSGGMGRVYLAEDTRLARRVAVKLLSPEFTRDADRVRRFEREARAASALNHPNIVTLHDIGTSEVGRFIVMELVTGKTIRELISDSLSMETIADIGRQIAEALEVAHAAGIVHRDIKPQNIMVRDDGYVKLLDFGLVRLLPHTEPATGSMTLAPDSSLVDSDAIIGTASYMSPEQAQRQSVASASDMFSLGIVLYQLATGKHPFASDSAVAYMNAIIFQTPTSPTRNRRDLPPELETLILSLLEKDPRLRPRAVQARQVLAALARHEPVERFLPVTVTPRERHTVGRERELAELQLSYDRVAAGRGEFVCLSGEPGIGKTTLAEDFLGMLRAHGRPARIGRGRCSQRLESTEAYLPLLEALEQLVQDNRRTGVDALKSLAPTWYVHVMPLSASDASAARLREDIRDASKDRMKREIVPLLGEMARTRPVVLFLDDLHWADAATIEMLAYVASKFDQLRVLIVATFRPTELLLNKHPFLPVKQDLQSRGVCRENQLGFLSREEIERYLALEFPRHRFSEEFVELVHRKTDGSPLFMVNLARHLRNRQMIAETDGRWELMRSIAEFESELPESVRSMIVRKVDLLNAADHTLLTAASVQGDSFDAAVIAEAVGADPLDVEDQLEPLEKVHALIARFGEQEFPDLTLTVRYRFVHALYRDAFYTALNPARRAKLSRAVAHSLARMHGDQASRIAGDLALLYQTGREFEKAGDFFVQAAENAASRFAHRQAADLFTQAINIAKRLGQTERVTDLRARRGKALANASMWADARTDLEAAVAELGMAHGTRRVEVLTDLALTCFYLLDEPGIRRYGNEALVLAEQAGRNDLMANALYALGYAEDGRLHESVERCERALQVDPRNQAPLEQLGRVLYWMGRHQEAIARSHQAAEWCQKVGRTMTAMMSLGDLGLSLTATGRYQEATEAFHQAERLGREFDLGGHRARAMVMRGGLHLHVFDFATAETIAEEARELARSTEWIPPKVSAGLDLLSKFARCGEVSRAENLLDEVARGIAIASGTHEWLWQLRFVHAQAELAIARGDWESALCHADRTLERSRFSGRIKYQLAGLLARAQALVGHGHKHEAIIDLQSAVKLAREFADPAMFLRTAVSLLELDGTDELADEARQAVDRITTALPDETMRLTFQMAETVRSLMKM